MQNEIAMRKRILKTVESEKVISIIRNIPKDQSINVAKALYEGGVRLVEITFDQRNPDHYGDTAAIIEAIREQLPEDLLVGAGTVTTTALVDLAASAGSGYIISPDTNADVIYRTREKGLVSMPGAMTPTEILSAHAAGADFVKLFPAASLGIDYFKAVLAPISHVKILAVGGIHSGNAREFLDAGAWGIGVGGNLTKRDWIAAGHWEKIAEAARSLVEAVKEDVHG